MLAKRVLIIDESPAAQEMYHAIAGLGPAVNARWVQSAQEALIALQDGPVDLLVCDLLLAGISGLEVMARERRHHPDTRAIMLSDVQDEAIRNQVARSGADALLFTPVLQADLLDAVERQLGLVQTLLPNELAVRQSAADTAHTTQQLAELRLTLQAYCVLLLSAQGQVLARAGVLPNPDMEASLLPHLLAARQATQRLAGVLGHDQPDDLLAVRGASEHVYLANLADGRSLAILTRPLNHARAAALAAAVGKAAQRMGQPLPLAEPLDLGATRQLEDTDPHLQQLLERADTRPSRVAAERYWQTVELAPTPTSGALSYEQAAQIGLIAASPH